MIFRKLMLATTTLTLAAAPVAAEAAVPARAAAPTAEESDLGGSDLMRALIIILIAGIGMVYLLVTDDKDPVSP